MSSYNEPSNDSRLSCGRSARGRNAPAAVDVVYWRTNQILPYIVAPASSKRLLAGGFCHRTKLVTENACPSDQVGLLLRCWCVLRHNVEVKRSVALDEEHAIRDGVAACCVPIVAARLHQV